VGDDEVVEHRRVLLPVQVEAELLWRATSPGTAGMSGRQNVAARAHRHEGITGEPRKGIVDLQKRPPLARYYYLPVKFSDSGSRSLPCQQILCYVARVTVCEALMCNE
jgi:hypothetical protein